MPPGIAHGFYVISEFADFSMAQITTTESEKACYGAILI